MLTSAQIRNKFVTFFEGRGHVKLASSPLIPQNDPTLLFANAGMNQFKDNFTGKANPQSKRAVTIQKCVRAGGKHNDLENVGMTARHHTFFEMLGNFSFGDYFKEDAIKFAWEFLTVELKIPKDKLFITVHNSDEEARMIWHKNQNIPLDRIFYRDDKDNFWEMGDTGPCGPCSEIFYDHGQEYSDGADTSDCILDDEGRYVEIWNLVFMQYEKFIEGGKILRRELPNPSIDTGAGLERVSACVQGKYWNYDTDGFAPILEAIEQLSGKKYTDSNYTTSMRVVADHIRSSVMLITDGVIPSNEGRGYVLRRIIRRAVRHIDELGLKETSFYKLIGSVFLTLGDEYPQNKANVDLAIKLLKLEEDNFRQTLKTGMDLINKEIKKLDGKKTFSGKAAFKLYDTYGFPLDLTQSILQDKKIVLDEKAYNKEMEIQRENSRATKKFSPGEDNLKVYYGLKETYGPTQFSGYTNLNQKHKLIAFDDQGEYQALVFKETPFYPEGGGQAGDQGFILDSAGNTVAEVIDTLKPIDDFIIHICEVSQTLKTGEIYELCVDKEKRTLTQRNHSATHLLQAALIEVLGAHIKQAGSRVDPYGLRFDFTQPQAMTKKEIEKVEELVNQKITEDLQVNESLMTQEEANQKGAMALFGEKYGDSVRVLQMGDFSLELCGGAHVKSTAEITLFKITQETALASGVRRIEALTSKGAIKYLKNRSQALAKVEKLLSSNIDNIVEKVQALQQDVKTKNKEISQLSDKIQAHVGKSLFNDKKELGNGLSLIEVNLTDGSAKDFRGLSDKFIDANKDDTLLLYTINNDSIAYLLRTDKKNSSINCAEILKETQQIVNGRGGGRADMSQGSGESKNVHEFLDSIKSKLKEI